MEKIPDSALVLRSDESGAKDITFHAPDGRVHEGDLLRPGTGVGAHVVGDVAVILSLPRPATNDDVVLDRPLEFALLPRASTTARRLPGRYAKHLFDAGPALWIGSHMLSGPLVFSLIDKRSQDILASAVARDDAQGGCAIAGAAAGGQNALAFVEAGADCRPRIRVVRVSR
ncbi:hypothetical protein [Polyangium fumosum]|uniref:Uncharacterized protein n=1 Tax=Polyangium fumosum TaxID=889272 RepID=A0A4U1J1R6_9BACT|nr:hypothetical protein [Polyangium fumosum]TKD01023.1 hypothetical protein E8A74_32165 [Polyangium fumosum]